MSKQIIFDYKLIAFFFLYKDTYFNDSIKETQNLTKLMLKIYDFNMCIM